MRPGGGRVGYRNQRRGDKFSLTMVEGLTGGHKFQFVLQDLEVLKRTCLASLVTTDFEEGACLVLEFFS
jgi:hypothetical protein